MARGKCHRPAEVMVKGDIAEIALRSGGVAIVDAADAEFVAGISWRLHLTTSGGRYVVAKLLGQDGRRRTVYLHRWLMGDDAESIDHRNGDGLDNRRTNLRECSQAENVRNRRAMKGRGLKGVYDRQGKAWRAQIRANGKLHRSSWLPSREEAVAAYNRMALELHGEFASLNAQPNPSSGPPPL